jgi:hypothetical protein
MGGPPSLGHSVGDAHTCEVEEGRGPSVHQPSITAAATTLIGDLRPCVAYAIRETVSGPQHDMRRSHQPDPSISSRYRGWMISTTTMPW